MADRTVPTETLWRRYVDIMFDHALALGQEAEVGGGRAIVSGGTESAKPTLVWAELDKATKSETATFLTSVTPGGQVISLGGHAIDAAVRSAGWYSQSRQLARLTNAKPFDAEQPVGVVLSARASLAAVTRWCDSNANEAGFNAGLLAHLDDPQYDAVVLLRQGNPVGVVGLQARGQVGLVCNAFVEPAHRQRGIGTMLLRRIVDLAARGQLVDVFATHAASDLRASSWLTRAGFTPVLAYTGYTASITPAVD